MSDYLPEAVVVEILLRLPPKTLVKCTSVCKAWNTIINSHTFISSHLQHSLSNPNPNPPLFLCHDPGPCRVDNDRGSLRSNVAPFPFLRIAKLEPPIREAVLAFRLVDSFHGVVCLTEETFHNPYAVVLWNPSIHRRVTIRLPDICHRAFGFGFDSKKNDYKVIKICYRHQVEVYSLNEGAWRVIHDSYSEFGVGRFSETQCFLNGNVHWIMWNVPNQPNYVLMFNVEEEKFKKMELPAEVVESNWVRSIRDSLGITVIQGCLSVVEYQVIPKSKRIQGCNIWMMREYGVAESWNKICIVNLRRRIQYVFGLRTSSKALVLPYLPYRKRDGIVSLRYFDTKSQEMTDLRIQGRLMQIFACDYTGSLVLLHKESVTMSYSAKKSRTVEGQDGISKGLSSPEFYLIDFSASYV